MASATTTVRPPVQAGEIQVDNVSKEYGGGNLYKSVVKNCSFTVERGKLTVMIGPSGCGKSTLIRLLAGFEKPTTGTVRLNGKPVQGPGRDRLVVFQETALFPWMTTYDNIMYGPRARGEDDSQAKAFAEFLLDKVGLKQFRDKYPPQLSGGMQRRAELARAMINNPEVSKELMWEYYATLYEESRRTNFFITTDVDEAIFLADRLLVMSNIPTQVCQVIEVDLPRPRRLIDMIDSERANEIKMEALSLLHREAMKSFAGGSRAAADFVEAYSKRVQKTEA
jgi:NitT/TauT family transport system ATP-binding protein